MRAKSARKKTKKSQKRVKSHKETEEQHRKERSKTGREAARRNLGVVYSKLMEDIERRCDEGGSSFSWHKCSYPASGPWTLAYSEETKNLVERKLAEDGYTVERTNKHERIRANEGQDESGITTWLKISW